MAPGRRVGGSWCASCRRIVASANDRMMVPSYRRASPDREGARPGARAAGRVSRKRRAARRERAESSRERAPHHDRGRTDDARGVDALPGRRPAAAELRRPLRPLEDRCRHRARGLSPADADHRAALGVPGAAHRRPPHGARRLGPADRLDAGLRIRAERCRARPRARGAGLRGRHHVGGVDGVVVGQHAARAPLARGRHRHGPVLDRSGDRARCRLVRARHVARARVHVPRGSPPR